MAYQCKTLELIMKAQKVSQNEQQTKQFTTFQQFFKGAQSPPKLFENKEKQDKHITPKNGKIHRSFSNKTHESLKDTKRKSVSVIKYVEFKLLKIFTRFRPYQFESSYTLNDNTVQIDSQTYTFDRVFNQYAQQEEIYDSVAQPTVQDFLGGINGCILAYGQTGSGKTYTMFGDQSNPGIILRSLRQIIHQNITIQISILEIYKDQIYDLISGASGLKLKEQQTNGFYVERLNKIKVESEQDCLKLLTLADENRHMAETKLNAMSSRSHLILTIYSAKTKLHLVDLAGSEKVSKTGAIGETLQEAKKINYSLSCLGHVIQCLSQAQDHVPFRDSKLTKLLQDSLSTDCRTSIIVACNPDQSNLDETISSLKFAQRAKFIRLHQRTATKRTYRDLELEVTRLQQELVEAKQRISTSLSNFQTRKTTESDFTCTESLRFTYRSTNSNNNNNLHNISDISNTINCKDDFQQLLQQNQQKLSDLTMILSGCQLDLQKQKYLNIQQIVNDLKQNQQQMGETIRLNNLNSQIEHKLEQLQTEQLKELQRIADYSEKMQSTTQGIVVSQMINTLHDRQKEGIVKLNDKLNLMHQDLKQKYTKSDLLQIKQKSKSKSKIPTVSQKYLLRK